MISLCSHSASSQLVTSKYAGLIANSVLILELPDTNFPVNISPALLYLMYRLITSGIAQLAQRQMDGIGGHAVHPVATNVTAPFLME